MIKEGWQQPIPVQSPDSALNQCIRLPKVSLWSARSVQLISQFRMAPAPPLFEAPLIPEEPVYQEPLRKWETLRSDVNRKLC